MPYTDTFFMFIIAVNVGTRCKQTKKTHSLEI